MTTLTELEQLAKNLHKLGDTAMITNPETILRLIELVKLQHEALEFYAASGVTGRKLCDAYAAYEEWMK